MPQDFYILLLKSSVEKEHLAFSKQKTAKGFNLL